LTGSDTALTQKGQVTIPVEVRKALGLRPRDRIRFEVDAEHGVATLRRAPSAILEIYGAVQPEGEPFSDSELHDGFERAVADEVVSET
jgi:antitoxin PrlF